MTTWGERLRAPFDNPVLRRELHLITRRGRFEWIVFVLTVTVTLAIASVGGRTGAGMHPAAIGRVLYQTFFGIAHGLVFMAGPAVAASSIAAEREGNTYEALALTGMSPVRVTWGKFLAAFTNVGSYVVALAPVGALPFLFGGVSAASVLYAFGMLFLCTALATLLGLAISARAPTTRTSLIAAVLAGAALAFVMYLGVGDAVGSAVCRTLGAPRAGTLWLPVLLAEGALTRLARLVLIGVPLLVALLTGWFLFEVCVANLSDVSSDRTTGLKRWYVVTVLTLAALGCASVAAVHSRGDRADAAITALGGFTLFALFSAFVFQGDAITAPRRVRLQWHARNVGIVRRFFGPGAFSSATLQLAGSTAALGALSAVGLLLALGEEYGAPMAPLGVVAMAIPAAMLVLFTVGLAMWLRVRFGVNVARVVLALVLVVLFVAPYAVTAILGASSDPDSLVPLLAAPSPLFALDLARRVSLDQFDTRSVTIAFGTTAAYGAAGLLLLIAATLRADRITRDLDADATRMNDLIAREDRAHAPPGDTTSA